MSDQRNLILAIVLSVGIILAFQFFYEMPRMRDAQQRQEAERAQTSQTVKPGETAQAPGVAVPGAAPGQPTTRAEALARSPRVPIDTGRIHGSISLKGGRIDDVTLANYHVTV